MPAVRLRAKVFVTTSLHTIGFKRGDAVQHVIHGRGVILGELGAFRDTDPNDGQVRAISGSGIFEVRFGREIHSVNGSRLSLVESAPSVHPFTQRFPALSDEDYKTLKASIQAHGQFEPIVLNKEGEILDGWHRWRICQELGIAPKTIPFASLKAAAPNLSEQRFIYDANVERRHLTATQKAVLALEFLSAIQKETQSRMRKAQTKGRATQQANRQHSGNGEAASSEPRKWVRGPTANQLLAQKAGICATTMGQVMAINKRAPELLPELVNGHLSAAKAIQMVAIKPKQALNAQQQQRETTLFSKENVLRQWRSLWSSFVLRFPPRRRKEVRQIVTEHLSAL